MECQVVDTKVAAERLGLAPITLMKKRTYGGGPPFVKMGKAVRYRVSDLDAWMAERVVRSTSEKVAA